MIDPHSSRAVYRQVADALRARIEDGSYGPGRAIPSLRTLMQEWEISRVTADRAISVLVGEGLVVTTHGQAARVADHGDRELVRVPRGSRVTSRMPTDAERVELDIEPGLVTPVIVIVIGGRPRVYAAHRVELTFN